MGLIAKQQRIISKNHNSRIVVCVEINAQLHGYVLCIGFIYKKIYSTVCTYYITIKIQISDYNYVAKINGGSRLKALTTILVIREERCTCFSDIQKYRHYV